MCEHKNIFKIQTGWYCPDCGQIFEKRPEKVKTEPKQKKTRKGDAK